MENSNALTKDQYLNIKKSWSQFSQARNNSSADHILYNAIRGKALSHGFKPIENPRKINAYGNNPDASFQLAMTNAKRALYLLTRLGDEKASPLERKWGAETVAHLNQMFGDGILNHLDVIKTNMGA